MPGTAARSAARGPPRRIAIVTITTAHAGVTNSAPLANNCPTAATIHQYRYGYLHAYGGPTRVGPVSDSDSGSTSVSAPNSIAPAASAGRSSARQASAE